MVTLMLFRLPVTGEYGQPDALQDIQIHSEIKYIDVVLLIIAKHSYLMTS